MEPSTEAMEAVRAAISAKSDDVVVPILALAFDAFAAAAVRREREQQERECDDMRCAESINTDSCRHRGCATAFAIGERVRSRAATERKE